ncbi:hypothetical protein FHR72_001722 [Mycolicibacterium iranicum]|uniref:Uncharacterized protein n=1 Tax=Mycolicibacterium iranicum TaxID=912594 RepID=A0A839Q5U9_MYCIR|nr:hypothetical protein [Mycolicibacterium iranicum]MBB2990254.1 hypothetical protein [Mycolicibacterium iranicum]
MTTTDDTPQHGADAQAGHSGPASTDDNRPPASEPNDQHGDDTDDRDDAEQDDDADDGSRSNREKRYRLRLRDAERQRDELADTLTRTRQAIVSSVVAGSGYAPKVAELVTADMDKLLDDNGIPDAEKIVSSLAAVVADYGFARQPRTPAPNLQQGSTNGGGGAGKASWAGAIKGSE